MSKTLKIDIVVDDNGTPVIKSFAADTARLMGQAERAGSGATAGLSKHFDTLKTHWLAVSAAITASLAMVYQAWNMAEASAGYLEQMQLLDGLARQHGTTSARMVDDIKRVSDGMISMSAAAETSAAALAKGMSADQMVKLSEAAVTLSDVMGTTAEDAFQRLGQALESGKERVVKLAVGLIDLEERYGAAASQMSEAERRQALYNIILEKAAEIEARAGSETKSFSDRMEMLTTTIKDAKVELGVGLVRAGALAIGVFQSVAAAALAGSGGIMKALSMLPGQMGEEWKLNAEAAFAAADELWKRAKDNFSVLTASTAELTAANGRLAPAMDASTASVKAQEEALKALNKRKKEAVDEAQDDLKALEKNKAAHEKYYERLQDLIEKNVETEKKALEEIKDLRAQEVDLAESTAKMLVDAGGTDEGYETKLSRLNDRWLAARTLSGQEAIDALEAYKKGVLDLQQAYKDAANATEIAAQAQSDINVAYAQQQAILLGMQAENRQLADVAEESGKTLQAEADKSKGTILTLEEAIKALSGEIAALDEDVEIEGVDRATPVIDRVIAKLHEMHAANKALTISTASASETAITATAATKYTGKTAEDYYKWLNQQISASEKTQQAAEATQAAAETAVQAAEATEAAADAWTGAGISTDSGATWSSGVEGTYAEGTDYVPKTGKYILHQGEMVIPPDAAAAIRAEDSRIAGIIANIRGSISVMSAAVDAASGATVRTAEDVLALARAQLSAYQGVFGRFTDFLTERTRSSWGQSEYLSEFDRLAGAFGASADIDTQIGILGEMLDVIETLEELGEKQLAAQRAQTESLAAQGTSISDWLMDLSQGALAPTMSSAGWAARFDEMLAAARADEGKVGEFLAYAQKYLEYERSYGSAGSYAAAYEAIVAAVSGLGDFMTLASSLSGLGIGDSLSEIGGVIESFRALGVSMAELTAAADSASSGGLQGLATLLGVTLPGAAEDAAGNAGTLSNTLMGTEAPFANVTSALNDLSSGVAQKIGEVSGFFSGLASSLGLTYNAGTLPTAVSTLTPTTYAEPSVMSAWAYYPRSATEGNWVYLPTNQNYVMRAGKSPEYEAGEWWIERAYGQDPGKYYLWEGLSSGKSYPTPAGLAEGGLTDGLTFAGERGQEWVVPTYEPERSRFLADVGADPAAIARAVARQITPTAGGGETHIHVEIDGREIAHVVARQSRSHAELQSAFRRLNA